MSFGTTGRISLTGITIVLATFTSVATGGIQQEARLKDNGRCYIVPETAPTTRK